MTRVVAGAARGSIISHVQSRLVSAPIDSGWTRVSVSRSIQPDDPSADRTSVAAGGQLPIADVAIRAPAVGATASTRPHRHRIPLEESRENSVAREFERFSVPFFFLAPFPVSVSSTLNFYRAFPPAFPACLDRWRDRLSVLENSIRPFSFFFSFFCLPFRSCANSWPKATAPSRSWIIRRSERFSALTLK